MKKKVLSQNQPKKYPRVSRDIHPGGGCQLQEESDVPVDPEATPGFMPEAGGEALVQRTDISGGIKTYDILEGNPAVMLWDFQGNEFGRLETYEAVEVIKRDGDFLVVQLSTRDGQPTAKIWSPEGNSSLQSGNLWIIGSNPQAEIESPRPSEQVEGGKENVEISNEDIRSLVSEAEIEGIRKDFDQWKRLDSYSPEEREIIIFQLALMRRYFPDTQKKAFNVFKATDNPTCTTCGQFYTNNASYVYRYCRENNFKAASWNGAVWFRSDNEVNFLYPPGNPESLSEFNIYQLKEITDPTHGVSMLCKRLMMGPLMLYREHYLTRISRNPGKEIEIEGFAKIIGEFSRIKNQINWEDPRYAIIKNEIPIVEQALQSGLNWAQELPE